MTHAETLAAAGLTHAELSGGTLPVHSPIDGAEVARIAETALADMPAIIAPSFATTATAFCAIGHWPAKSSPTCSSSISVRKPQNSPRPLH